MVLPSSAFACDVCHKPLGVRRARQGVRSHPGCRRALPPTEVDAVLGAARGALERLPSRTSDPELRQLFAQAAAQARELIDDLQRLKSFVGTTPARDR